MRCGSPVGPGNGLTALSAALTAGKAPASQLLDAAAMVVSAAAALWAPMASTSLRASANVTSPLKASVIMQSSTSLSHAVHDLA